MPHSKQPPNAPVSAASAPPPWHARLQARKRARRRRWARGAALWTALIGAFVLVTQQAPRRAARPAEAAQLAPAASRVAGWRGETKPPTRRAGKKPARKPRARAATRKRRGNWMQVWATAYCPTCRVCDTGRITASGRHAYSRGLAVAARGRKVAPMGSRVYVPRFGWLLVDDTGGGVHSNQIDIRMQSHRRAVLWGRRRMRVLVAAR